MQTRITPNKDTFHAVLNINCLKHPFSAPWKYQKTLQFSFFFFKEHRFTFAKISLQCILKRNPSIKKQNYYSLNKENKLVYYLTKKTIEFIGLAPNICIFFPFLNAPLLRNITTTWNSSPKNQKTSLKFFLFSFVLSTFVNIIRSHVFRIKLRYAVSVGQ